MSSSEQEDQANKTSGLPSEDALRRKIDALVATVDLEKTGVKQFTKLLSQKFGGVDLQSKKDFIKAALTEAINRHHQEEEEEEEAPADSDEDDDDEPRAAKGKKKKSGGAGGGGGGLAERKELSPALAGFLRKGNKLARTEIVKSLWEYIREHNLQNPDNKREILLDDALQKVFGVKTFTMFTMNKYISAHVHPFKPVDLSSPSSTPTKKRKQAASSSKKKKSKKKDGSDKKKRKAGTQPPYRLSKDLIAIVGESVLPRPQVVSKIWEYIKANDLQDPSDKRQILCDAALKRVMGGNDKVTMFNMNVHISKHLLEKVEKGAYQHSGGSGQKDSDDDDDDDEGDSEAEGEGDDDEGSV